MKSERRNMRLRNVTLVRIVLFGLFVFFVVGFAIDQYGLVRDSVRFICTSCLGLSQ